MIPMIGLLLCVYLVFKGFEIFQIALCSSTEFAGRSSGIALGVIAIILSVLIGGFFALSFLSSSMQAVPQFPAR